jgi:hypothetical protein
MMGGARQVILLAALAMAPIVAADGDPRAALDEARTLRLAGRLDEALEKHLWFQDNASRIEPALIGVRLSFALAEWGELAKIHPAASAAMQARFAAFSATFAATGDDGAWMEVTALGRQMASWDTVADLLEQRVATLDPDLDRSRIQVLARSGEEAVIRARRLDLYNRLGYADPARAADLAETYADHERLGPGIGDRDLSRQMLVYELAPLRSFWRVTGSSASAAIFGKALVAAGIPATAAASAVGTQVRLLLLDP